MAKMDRYGGNAKCIVAEPDIFSVPVDDQLDYILIGSDGIFDRISTEETCKIAIDEVRLQTESMKIAGELVKGSFGHVSKVCGDAVDRVMTKAMEYESMDNLSVVIITFKNLTRFVENMEPQ